MGKPKPTAKEAGAIVVARARQAADQAAHDAETVRLVREFAYKMRRAKGFSRRLYKSGEFSEYELCAAYGVAKVASKLISILNRPATGEQIIRGLTKFRDEIRPAKKGKKQ